MYVGECQDANKFNKDLIKGNLLMCSYSIRFVLGLSTIKRASETAKNLSAAGVVFYMDPYVIGFQLNPVPMKMPGIILASTNDSKVPCYPFTFSVLYGLDYLGNTEGKDMEFKLVFLAQHMSKIRHKNSYKVNIKQMLKVSTSHYILNCYQLSNAILICIGIKFY